MASVFISYSRQDLAFVKVLTEALQAQKHEVWVDLQNIPPSAQWRQEIDTALTGADTVIFVLSPASVSSKECAEELAFA